MKKSRFNIAESCNTYPSLGTSLCTKWRVIMSKEDTCYILQRHRYKWRSKKYFANFDTMIDGIRKLGLSFSILEPYYTDKEHKYDEYYAYKIPYGSANVKKAIPDFLKDNAEEIKRLKSIYRLRDLFTRITGESYHVDHMWPLSRGGPHWSGNLQLLTAKENISKHAKINEDIKQTIKSMLAEEEKLHG